MPYIIPGERHQLDPFIDKLASQVELFADGDSLIANSGRLNYICTRLGRRLMGKPQYWKLALIAGVFVTVLLEFYRRAGAPYEDRKVAENGDVYD